MSAENPTSPHVPRDIPFLSLLRKLWPYLRRVRRRLWSAGGISLLLTSAEVATPILVGLFVDSILAQLHGRAPGGARALSQPAILALIAVAAVLRGFLVARQRWLAGRIGETVAARMRDDLWDHLQHLPLDYTRARGPGQLLLRFTTDARAVQRVVTNGVVQLSQDVLLALGIFVALAFLNWRMALVMAAVLPIFAAIFWRLNPRLQDASRAARARRSRLSSYLHDRLVGMAIVKAFVRQPREAGSVKELNADIAKRATRRWHVEGQLQGLATATLAGASVFVLAVAAREAGAGRITAGALVAFYTLLALLLPVFQRFVVANRYFQEGQISVDRLLSTLALPTESRTDDNAPDLRVSHGEVEVRNLSFSHRDGPPVLSGVSFHARRGGIVAVVGPNGSGKTTLIELLLRFHQPTSGSILIDGQDIAGVSLQSLRAQAGFVAQDAPLFDGSIRENIAYGLPQDAPEARLLHAAQLAGMERLLESLPKGWDTRVGRGGRILSSGSRRRIALARALAVDPPILLLDEPFSALDPEAEQSLCMTLQRLAQDKTIIVAAHRLPSWLKPAEVHVLEEGRAQNSPEEVQSPKFKAQGKLKV